MYISELMKQYITCLNFNNIFPATCMFSKTIFQELLNLHISFWLVILFMIVFQLLPSSAGVYSPFVDINEILQSMISFICNIWFERSVHNIWNNGSRLRLTFFRKVGLECKSRKVFNKIESHNILWCWTNPLSIREGKQTCFCFQIFFWTSNTIIQIAAVRNYANLFILDSYYKRQGGFQLQWFTPFKNLLFYSKHIRLGYTRRGQRPLNSRTV